MNVSIIIPAYNASATIGQAIGSALAQTASGWELIVVNDGSTDDTRAVAAALAGRHKRVRILDQANGGESAARNTGIAAARHEWLLFLDADDWIAPAHLEILTAVLESDPALDAVHCGWVRVAQDGTHTADQDRPLSGDLFPVLARRAAFPVHACIVRRSLVDDVGRFDVTLKKSPDWDLWQRVARSGAKFGRAPEVLAYYRMLPNSASLEAERLLVDGLTVLRRGHASDPRVPHPRPEYADGLPGSTVQSQEFYLLSWCAGLLLGSGEDARPLMRHVRDDSYGGLYPDAVAKCIFESATLPSCRPLRQWEELWPGIKEPAQAYLLALEEHSKTQDLASRAMCALKRLILKESPTWGPVIETEERQTAELRDTIARFVEGTSQLESARDHWRGRAETTERQNIAAAQELADAVEQSASVQQYRASLQTQLGEAVEQIGTLQHDRTSLQTRLGEAVEQIGALQHDRTSLQTQLSEAVEQIGALQHDRTSLQIQLSEAVEQIGALQHDRTSLQTQLSEAVEQIGALQHDRTSLQTQLSEAVEQIGALQHDRTSLQIQLSEAVEQIGALQHDRTSLQTQLSEAVEQIGALQHDRTSLQTQLGEANGRVKRLEKENEASEAARQAAIQQLNEIGRQKASLEEQRNALDQELAGLQIKLSTIENDNRILIRELEKWQQSATDRGVLIEELQNERWVRIGLRLGILTRREVQPATQEMTLVHGGGEPPEPPATGEDLPNWELRVAEGCEAHVIYPREDHEMVKIGITKAATRTDWDIQLNRPGFKVVAGQQYAVAFRARAARPRMIGVGFAKAQAPWSSLGMYAKIRLTPEWQAFQQEFVALEDEDNARIHFDLGGRKIGIDLTSVTLREGVVSAEAQDSSAAVAAAGGPRD